MAIWLQNISQWWPTSMAGSLERFDLHAQVVTLSKVRAVHRQGHMV